MALLKIKIELSVRRRGIEMPKLIALAREAQKLLKMLATDTGLTSEGVWVAQAFYEQGLGFDATLQSTELDDLQAKDPDQAGGGRPR